MTVCLTRKFDGPQPCKDWIELAKKTTECRDLGIQKFTKTGETLKSGRPKKAWSTM